jgi:peptidoglycan/LPS O-acetylase OafA/YrhL
VNYRPDIDGLRGIAVLLVVAFHAAPTLLPFGYLGVDVFFVISGYVITRDIAARQEAGAFTLLDFYLRRVRRIFPALLVVLAASVLIGAAVMFGQERRQLLQHVVASTLFVQNANLFLESGYFDTDSITKPLLHLWSLAVEEQFYLLWPLLLMRFRSIARAVMLVMAGSLALWLAYWWFDQGDFAHYMLPTRAWQLLAGALLALRPEIRPPLRYGALSLLLLVPGPWNDAGGAIAATVAAWAVIGAGESTRVAAVLRSPVLVSIGRVSYPLYLWHWPLLSFLHIAQPKADGAAIAFAVALSVVLAYLTAWLVEKPVRVAPERSRRVAAVAAGFVFAGITSAAGAALLKPDPRTLDLEFDALMGVCPPWFKPQGMRCYGQGRKVLIGDSHAEHIYPGLGDDWLMIYRPGCFPSTCDFLERTLQQVAASDAEVVVLSFRSRGDADAAAIGKAIKALAGKRVAVVVTVPELPFNPRDCIERMALQAVVPDCSITPSQAVNAQARARLSEASSGATVIDPANALCAGRCQIQRDGMLVYRDKDHLSIRGARIVGAAIVGAIKVAASSAT